jgi:hypothetical protein
MNHTLSDIEAASRVHVSYYTRRLDCYQNLAKYPRIDFYRSIARIRDLD